MRRFVKVRLLGKLGKIFGREHELWIANPSEAIRLLSANFDNFSEYLARSDDDGIHYRVIIDDNAIGIEKNQFDYPIRRTLIIAPIMTGAGAIGRILTGIGLIAAAFFMPASISLFGLTLTSTAVGLLGASLVVGGIFQALSPVPRLPSDIGKRSTTEQKGSYLFDRASQVSTQGLAVPVGFGDRLIADPIVISSGITSQLIKLREPDEEGNDDEDDEISALPEEEPNSIRSIAYLETLYLLGEGEIEGTTDLLQNIFLNDTPIKNKDGSFNFKGVTARLRRGTPNQTIIPFFNNIENESAVGVKVTKNTPVVRTIADPNADRVRIRLMFPALQDVQEFERDDVKQTRIVGTSIVFKIEVQTDGGVWTQIGRNKKIRGRSSSPFERQYEFALPKPGSSWNVRITRITNNSNRSTLQNDLYWQSFTKIINEKLNYPNSALLGLRIRSDTFSSQPRVAIRLKWIKCRVPHNYNPATKEYFGNFNGTLTSTKFYTNNPAWVFYELITNDRFGLGKFIDPNVIDISSLYTIGHYCDQLVSDGKGGYEPRFTCNVYLQSREEAHKVLESFVSCFRGMLYYLNGTIVATQDRPKTPIRFYNESNVIQEVDENGNVTSPPFNYPGTSLEARHTAVYVYWDDPSDSFKKKPYYEQDDNAIARYGYNPIEVVGFGCTSEGQARRIAKWMLLSETLLTKSVVFRVGTEGSLSLPGDVFNISDPLKTVDRWGGRIKSGTSTTVVLDSPVTFNPARAYSLGLIDPSTGQMVERYVNNPGITTDTIAVSFSFGFTPIAGTVWQIQSDVVRSQSFTCVSVDEINNNVYEIAGIEYNDSIFDAVDFGESFEEQITSALPNPFTPPDPPTGLTVTETLYVSNNSAGVKTRIEIIFSPSISPWIDRYEVEYKPPFDEVYYLLSNTRDNYVYIDDAVSGSYTFRVRSINSYGKASPYVVLTKEIYGLRLPPQNVTGFSAVPLGDICQLNWDKSPDLDVRVGGYYIIRHTIKTTGATWLDGLELGRVSGSTTETKLPVLDGTYLIKAFDSSGNASPQASIAVLSNYKNLLEYDRVINRIYQPFTLPTIYHASINTVNYQGEGVVVENGKLKLQNTTHFNYPLKINGILFDDQPGNFDDYNDPNFRVVPYGRFNTEQNIILEEIVSPVRIVPLFSAIAIDETSTFDRATGNFDLRTGNFDSVLGADASTSVSVNYEMYAYQGGGSPNHVPNLITGDYAFSTARIDIVLRSDNPSHNIEVSQAELFIDIPERTEGGSITTSASASTVVNFQYPFREIPIVSTTMSNALAGDYVNVSNITKTGFTIDTFNSSASRVARSITWIAKGFGKVLS